SRSMATGIGQFVDLLGALVQHQFELGGVACFVGELAAQLDDDAAQFVNISFQLGDVGASFLLVDYGFLTCGGSCATFAAIRRASPLLNNLAAVQKIDLPVLLS